MGSDILIRFADVARKPWYPFACIGVGFATGYLTELVMGAVKDAKSLSAEMAEAGLVNLDAIEEAGEVREYAEKAAGYLDDGVRKVSEAFEKPEMDEVVDTTKIVDYTRYAKEKLEEIAKPDEGEAMKELEVPPMSMIDVISEEEFLRASGNSDGFVTVVGTWFPDERILAGWDDKLEEKPAAENIGDEAVRLLDDGAAAVYVRNRLVNVLFEVVRSQDSWEDAVADATS